MLVIRLVADVDVEIVVAVVVRVLGAGLSRRGGSQGRRRRRWRRYLLLTTYYLVKDDYIKIADHVLWLLADGRPPASRFFQI